MPVKAGVSWPKHGRACSGAAYPKRTRNWHTCCAMRAAFARMEGDLVAAERDQREALRRLEAASNTFELAVTRYELAALLLQQGKLRESAGLLAQALPVMRQAVLPEQVSLKAAEALAVRVPSVHDQGKG